MFFEERQYIPTWARLLVALDVPVVALVLFVARSEDDWRPWTTLTLVLVAALSVSLTYMHLWVLAEPGRITVRFWPFPRRIIHTRDIESYKPRQYSPLAEYGGWGIKGTRKNRAYNARGNLGVQLVLKNGERVLIGSQRPDELAAAIGLAMDSGDSGLPGIHSRHSCLL